MTTPKQAAAELQRLHDRAMRAAERYAKAPVATERAVRESHLLDLAEQEFSAALARLFDLPDHSND